MHKYTKGADRMRLGIKSSRVVIFSFIEHEYTDHPKESDGKGHKT
ncbi:hypothetical protein LSO9J_10001 [Candidatus Liberibacter solanacearum]